MPDRENRGSDESHIGGTLFALRNETLTVFRKKGNVGHASGPELLIDC